MLRRLTEFRLLLALFMATPILATIGSLVGIGTGISSLVGGSDAPKPPQAPQSLVSGIPQASQDWMNLLQAMYNPLFGTSQFTQIPASLGAAYQKMLGIPTQPMINAGNAAGSQYTDLANLAKAYTAMMGPGGQAGMAGQGMTQLAGMAPQVWNAATTAANNQPMYDYLRGQTSQDAAVGNAMYGLMGPQAAGNVTDALSKFDMQWPQENLGLLTQGAQGVGNIYNSMRGLGQLYGADLGSSFQFGQGAPAATMASAQTPFDALMTAYGLPMTAAGNYSGAFGTDYLGVLSGLQQNIIPYVNQGVGAANNNFLNQMTAFNTNNQQQASGINAALTGLSGLGNSPMGSAFQNWFNQNVWGGGGAPVTSASPSQIYAGYSPYG